MLDMDTLIIALCGRYDSFKQPIDLYRIMIYSVANDLLALIFKLLICR